MADKKDEPLILKVKVPAHVGAHGGAWKVAYADFVTAMMAFFLLMWLLNATNEETKKGLADYFKPVVVTSDQVVVTEDPTILEAPPSDLGVGEKAEPPATPGELKEFEQTEKDVQKALQEELKEFSENVQVNRTPEGLEISIIDSDKQPMFASGSAKLPEHTLVILKKIGEIVANSPQLLSVDGHTDAVPFLRNGSNGNWDLSAARAAAARRALESDGVGEDRFFRVLGQADRERLDKADPNAPKNRRISVVLLKDSITGRRTMTQTSPLPPRFGAPG